MYNLNNKTMTRMTVRVSMPVNKPDDFAKLMKRIAEKNKQLGKESPLTGLKMVKMEDFEKTMSEADKFRQEAEILREQSEAKMNHARVLYGTNKQQNINTVGTMYYMANIIKNFLLLNYKGTEEDLSEWGFDVVVKKASTGKKNTPVNPPKS